MYPSHPVIQNFVPGHFLFIQSSVCKTIVELADCDVVQLSESTVELSIYTRMVVMFAYRHAYHTIETSTSILQSGNWANRTVKANVHSMENTMIPFLSHESTPENIHYILLECHGIPLLVPMLFHWWVFPCSYLIRGTIPTSLLVLVETFLLLLYA